MFDAGSGFFRAIPLMERDTLDILLSHAHLDHVLGLTFLLDLLAKNRLARVRVFGEREKLAAIRKHVFADLVFPVMPAIEWQALEDQSSKLVIGGARVTWFKMEHPGGSVGYRLDWPEVSLAYVTDTTSRKDSAYWAKVAEVDWLVHECNFRDDEIELAELTGHSWLSAVLEGAAVAKVSRLILTHINPLAALDDPLGLSTNPASHFRNSPGRLIVAEDRLVVELDTN